MSTRATYRLSNDNGTDTTFYIHHDGYPAGAAEYFWAMHHCPNDRGGLAERFLRANDGAEVTGGHDAHGDTQWRYTVIASGLLTVACRTTGEGWRHYGSWPHYAAFINEHPTLIKQFEPLHPVREVHGAPVWLTRSQVAARLEAATVAHTRDYWKAVLKEIDGAAH